MQFDGEWINAFFIGAGFNLAVAILAYYVLHKVNNLREHLMVSQSELIERMRKQNYELMDALNKSLSDNQSLVETILATEKTFFMSVFAQKKNEEEQEDIGGGVTNINIPNFDRNKCV